MWWTWIKDQRIEDGLADALEGMIKDTEECWSNDGPNTDKPKAALAAARKAGF